MKKNISTGASNDIKVATNIARNMVTQWGFSDKLGPILYTEDEGEVFSGRSMAKAKHMSDETAHAIDEEVRAIVNRNYARARQILIDNMDILHAMKDALVKYETIEEEQIKQLMNREPVTPPSGWEDNKDTKPTAKPQEEKLKVRLIIQKILKSKIKAFLIWKAFYLLFRSFHYYIPL